MKNDLRRPTDKAKIPPSDVELEKTLLAVVVQYPDMLTTVLKWVRPEMFYLAEHVALFKAIRDIYVKDGEYDASILMTRLRDQEVEGCNLMLLVVSMMTKEVDKYNVERYAIIISEYYTKRECILLFMKYSDEVYAGKDICDVYDQIRADLDELFAVNVEDMEKINRYEKGVLTAAFRDEHALLYICDRLSPDEFSRNGHKRIFMAYRNLLSKDVPINKSSVEDELQSMDKNTVAEFGVLASADLDSSWPYMCKYLIDNCSRKKLRLIAKTILDNNYDDLNKVLESLTSEIDFIRTKDSASTSMKVVVDSTLSDINKFDDGKKTAYLKTGEGVLNNVAYITPESLVVIAGAESSGKTRWMIHNMKDIFALNERVSCMWCTFEDPQKKIVRAFISSDTGLSDAQLTSKNYKLSDEDKRSIRMSTEVFCKYDIEFIDVSMSVRQISSMYRIFCKKRRGRRCILIIDNFMLIDDVVNGSGNQTAIEDSVMSELRKLVKSTNKDDDESIIFLLHHITKEASAKFNKDECYRPRMSNMKGTTRVGDAANIVILLNYMGKHKDILKEQAGKPDLQYQYPDGSWHYVKRPTILKRLLIAEVAKNRDGDIDDDRGLMHKLVDFATLKFTDLKCRR